MAVTCDMTNVLGTPWDGRGESLAHFEVEVPNGGDTINVDVPGGVLAAVVFPANVDGTKFTVKTYFPWSGTPAYISSDIPDITKPSTTPGWVTISDYDTWKSVMGKFQLKLDTAQTTDVTFGLIFWHS